MDTDEPQVDFSFEGIWRAEDDGGRSADSLAGLFALRRLKKDVAVATNTWHRALRRALLQARRLEHVRVPLKMSDLALRRVQYIRAECIRVAHLGRPGSREVHALTCPVTPSFGRNQTNVFPWTKAKTLKALDSYDRAIRQLVRRAARWFAAYNDLARMVQCLCHDDACYFAQDTLIGGLVTINSNLDHGVLLSLPAWP